jgi:tRNA (mo5U34)-methyltransferase
LWIRSIVARALNLPVFASNNPGEISWSSLPDRCLVAMHWRHSAAFERFLRREGFRIAVTSRHPLDVLVSILHFSVQPVTARWLEGECGNENSLVGESPDSRAFAEYCLSPRAEALLGVSTDWQPSADASVRYEDVKGEPGDAITRLLQVLGAAPLASIDEAVSASSLDRVPTIAQIHAWRGRTGDWRLVVPPPLAGQAYELHRRHFEAFGYSCDPDPALDSAQARRNWIQMTRGDADAAPPADAGPSTDAAVAPAPSARPDTRTRGPLDLERLRRDVAAIRWFHRIDLADGIVTPGQDIDGRAKIAFAAIPDDLSGKTVLDIGAWDGFFSFEAEKRGAARVLATDSFVWSGSGWGSKAGFELARRALGSRVEDMDVDVMDLDPSVIGTFDVVFSMGVLYHLRNPFLALEKVAAVTRDRLILSTWADLTDVERPAAAFYPTTELGGDPSNWWGLNPPCLRAMLEDVGFTRITIMSPADPGDQRGPSPIPMAIHAWKGQGARRP